MDQHNRLQRLVEHVRHGEAPRLAAQHARSVARVGDTAGRLRMLRMLAEAALGREEDDRPAASAKAFRVPELANRMVWLRPRSRDRAAFESLALGRHLAPAEMPGPVRHVAVFGAGIGLALADLADEYPEARVLGVEPGADEATLARRNTEHLRGRGRIVETAVWRQAGQAAPGSAAARAAERFGTGQVIEVPAGDLLTGWTGGPQVDYLLIRVPDGWQDLLTHPDWAPQVRCVKVELPDGAETDEALRLLEKAGYRARPERAGHGAAVVGLRL